MSRVIIIGGDRRQRALEKIFEDEGFECISIDRTEDFSDKIFDADDAVILPVPVSKDGVYIFSTESHLKIKKEEVLSCVKNKGYVFGGGFSDADKIYMIKNNVNFLDYMMCEEFLVYNAYLTGLGAVKLLLEKTYEDIKGKKVLITGFGRVAEYTASELKNIGAEIFVTARKSLQCTKAECYGYKTVCFKEFGSRISEFDYIFNTVPENIFTAKDVAGFNGTYFELASYPYGVSQDLFSGEDNRYCFGGGLPGRYLPDSAAEKIASLTLAHIKPEGRGD